MTATASSSTTSTPSGRPAPVADWITIPELYADPFPAFQRLRAEGGVHWVPAIGRYLITSYDAVHDTEMDQQTYSANEQGSLMIRAMGHSMLRKDDPEHHIERRAWQPALKPSAIRKTWRATFERTAESCLERFIERGPGADLVWDFAAPFAAESLRAVTGLHNVTADDLQRWSQTMIDATGNYADDPEVWARGEASYREVDDALDEMLDWHARFPDDSLISALLAMPDYAMPLDSIRANLKMTIGGGLNEPRDAIGVAAWALLTDPAQRELATQDPTHWDAVFDEAIRWVAPIGMYSRQTTRDTVLQGVHLPAGARLGISLLSANRDETKWTHPERFDLTRPAETPHLAFGKGVHVCLGAWVARAEVADVALPMLFDRLPNLRLDPDQPARAGGWVFRGMDALPVLWDTPTTAPGELTRGPQVAVVGSGPSGCYTAQAVRKRIPEARVTVIDRQPFPYGLVRLGVAPDHQGTKAVSDQFARLFEQDSVEFMGSVRVGSGADDQVSLAELRASFDAVVLATGLHQDAQLSVEGSDLPGVHGAGRITRLLNSAVDEVRPAPALGRSTAVVGMGNVAMDLVRMLATTAEGMAGSDVCDQTHAQLTAELRQVHVIGRSLPAEAKFDPVMLREILDLPGVEHVVHGVDVPALAAAGAAGDRRCELVAEMAQRSAAEGAGAARVRVEWWFEHTPEAFEPATDGDAAGVAAVRLRPSADVPGADDQQGQGTTTAASLRIPVDSVITAVGFRAGDDQQLAQVDEQAQATGRIEPGLYVAGWARRGPRGTIPSQRTDAQQLADLMAQDLPAVSSAPGADGLRAALTTVTDYAAWRMIDAHETRHAAEGRVRRKITDPHELRIAAGAAFGLPSHEADPTTAAGEGSEQGAGPSSGYPFSGGSMPSGPVTILFGTESGNAELVAEELAGRLGRVMEVRTVDLARATPEDLDAGRLHLVACSTYGDGELPTSVRAFHAALESERPDLTGLRYAVFGLGDRSYAQTYSRGSEILDETLRELGAERVGEYGRHDAGGQHLAPAMALRWAMGVLQESVQPSS